MEFKLPDSHDLESRPMTLEELYGAKRKLRIAIVSGECFTASPDVKLTMSKLTRESDAQGTDTAVDTTSGNLS